MIEKKHEIVDNGRAFGALLGNLLFDCLPLEFLVAKFQVSGFDMKSLILIYDYLSNRKQLWESYAMVYHTVQS